jgi:choline dehydrogenase-like flavoprotein
LMVETHFDVVIVGSGFGGSVMAYRLAEAGLTIRLRERGKAYPPNSFPRSPYGMRENLWDPGEGLFGLYNFWSFHRIHVLVASGLGGGSLIYANVLLRKDEEWFVKEDLARGGHEHWPITRADLEPYYDAVEGKRNTPKASGEKAKCSFLVEHIRQAWKIRGALERPRQGDQEISGRAIRSRSTGPAIRHNPKNVVEPGLNATVDLSCAADPPFMLR